MRTLLLAVALGMFAAPVAAEPATTARTPAVKTATDGCRTIVNNRGKARRVCKVEKTIVVSTEAPRPQVLIVHGDARKIVGRPRSENRLADSPRHLP